MECVCVAPAIRSVMLEFPISYSTPRLLLHTKLVTKAVPYVVVLGHHRKVIMKLHLCLAYRHYQQVGPLHVL